LTDESQTFTGRAAIVTGATRGIGRAIALELARCGANIAFNYARSAEAANSLVSEIEALGAQALSAQCDVAQTEAAVQMVKNVKDRFGRELNYEDIAHYQKIIVALTETNRLMKEINQIEAEI